VNRQVLQCQCEQPRLLFFDNDTADVALGQFAYQQFAGVAETADEIESLVDAANVAREQRVTQYLPEAGILEQREQGADCIEPCASVNV
jgi:hypothetical protein